MHPSRARAIAAADFDRNGWPDIAQANTGRNTVTILLNTNGVFARGADVAVGLGPFDITTGDYNRDGIADLAVANADGHSISVLLGRGTGMFTRTDIAAAGQSPRGITTADVNNDGKPDWIIPAMRRGSDRCSSATGPAASRAVRPTSARCLTRKASTPPTSIMTAPSMSRSPTPALARCASCMGTEARRSPERPSPAACP